MPVAAVELIAQFLASVKGIYCKDMFITLVILISGGIAFIYIQRNLRYSFAIVEIVQPLLANFRDLLLRVVTCNCFFQVKTC